MASKQMCNSANIMLVIVHIIVISIIVNIVSINVHNINVIIHKQLISSNSTIFQMQMQRVLRQTLYQLFSQFYTAASLLDV